MLARDKVHVYPFTHLKGKRVNREGTVGGFASRGSVWRLPNGAGSKLSEAWCQDEDVLVHLRA